MQGWLWQSARIPRQCLFLEWDSEMGMKSIPALSRSYFTQAVFNCFGC